MERGERCRAIPSSRRVTARRHDWSALCWRLPELFTLWPNLQGSSSDQNRVHASLFSGRLRHSFDLKCNWHQRHFQRDPTKNTPCSLDALLFLIFLTYVSAVWTEIFITFCLLHLQPLTVDSCGLLFFSCFLFSFVKKTHKRKVGEDPAEISTCDISDWIGPFFVIVCVGSYSKHTPK